MIGSRTLIALVVLGFGLVGQAQASESWSCKFSRRDGAGITETQDFVEDGKVLHALFDDYSGKTGRHEIIETSPLALIAMSHFSREAGPANPRALGVTLIILNKESGALRLLGYNALSEFEESYKGTCSRK